MSCAPDGTAKRASAPKRLAIKRSAVNESAAGAMDGVGNATADEHRAPLGRQEPLGGTR